MAFPTKFQPGYNKKNEHQDTIDLRKETTYILNNYGYFVLLRRNYKKIHCSCYTESIYKDYDLKCPYCSTGFVNRIEKHLTRNDLAVGERTVVQYMNDMQASRYNLHAYKFYFNHYVMPNEQDIIYVVTWDDSKKPQSVVKEYEVVAAIDRRSDYGRIEYWVCYTRSRAFGMKPVKEITIRRLEDENIYKDYPDAELQYDLVW